MRIVRIEERLSCQSLLHDAVGRREYDDGGPAASPAAHYFSDQDSATAVQRNEQHQGRQRGQGYIAKQELRYQWCDHQQEQYRRHTRPPASTFWTGRGITTRWGNVSRLNR
jgi:hypothetical protein